jgi:hypothetical protein
MNINNRFLVQRSLCAGLLTAGAFGASAATVTAGSCAQSAVQTAVNSASDGDTVVVPAGTCTWSSAVSVSNKTIILRGSGSAAGGTRIQHGGGSNTLIAIEAGSKTGKMDLSGFWFSGASNDWGGTAVQIGGPSGWKNLRIHHNVFDGNYPWTIRGSASTHGLIDNNIFRGRAYGILLNGSGAADWSTPLVLGSADFFFVEDNRFEFDDFYGNTGAPVMDMYSGGRVVFRNNTVRDGLWETHDKARSGLVSANAYEIYNNTFTASSNKWKGLDISSGTGAVWNNTFSGDYTVAIGAIDYKSFDPRGIRACDGTDPADQNVAGQSGWRCQYQIGTQGEGASAYSYPLYLWNNRLNGAGTDMKCTSGCQHLQAGRDFINNGSAAKPGYAAYAYPHPLQSGGPAPQSPPPAPAVLPPPAGLSVR